MKNAITEISGYPYPDKISCFRSSCRNYRSNQYLLRKMEQSLQEQKIYGDRVYDYAGGQFCSEADFKRRYVLLKDRINEVEEVLRYVRISYGEEAAGMLEEAYIQGKKQKKIAHQHRITENVLQKKYRFWLENAVYRNNEVRS
ncbi:MAG: hypothetical protein GX478_08095 [Erysipelotrichaceae bacterium]|jgi:hypothetical protein|nr:hypothetical protein [Erysipelotrichaceae bacterium]